jgi:ligand-binding sensor domain-containing protein
MTASLNSSRLQPALVIATAVVVIFAVFLSGPFKTRATQNEASTLSGIVEDELGTPVAAAKVTVTRKDSLASWSTLTQADGRFEFKNLFPGNYTLTAEAAGFRRVMTAVTISRPGEPVAAQLKLKPTSLHVAVFDAGTRQPLPGVSVTISARERGGPVQPAGRAVTDEAGDAYFGRLAPGSYQITAAQRGFDEYHSVVFISSGKITTEFALPLSIAPVIPVNDKLSIRYNVPNLPSKNILSIFQDSDGWMWFGTDKGVARFNGTDFRSSSVAGSSYSALSGLEVRSIAEDRQGLIWLATPRGVRRVSKDGDDAGELLSGVDARNLMIDSHGGVWVSTSAGEFKYAADAVVEFREAQGLPTSDTRCSVEGPSGAIFIATADGVSVEHDGIVSPFPGNAKEETRLAEISQDKTSSSPTQKPGRDPGSDRSKTKSGSLNTGDVRSVFVDSGGNLWLATADGALFLGSGPSGKLNTAANTVAEHVGVRALAQDKTGHMWFALDSGGAMLYSPGRKETQRIPLVERDRVNSVLVDREGNVWIATDDGVVRADLYSFVDFNTSRGLLDNSVNQIVEEPVSAGADRSRAGGKLWFVTSGGVSVMEGERLVPLEGFRANIGGRSVAFDKNGAAWFATEQGIFRLDAQALTQLNQGNGLASDNVNWIAATSEGAVMVIATAKGVDMYKDGSLTQVDQLSGYDVRHVAEDRNGRLWFSSDKGVVTFEPSSGTISLLDAASGLYDNDVRWIASAGNRMVVATGRGVQLCDIGIGAGVSRGSPLINLDTEPASTVMVDKQGYLWIGTDDGQVKKLALLDNQFISTVYSGETAALTGKHINSIYEDGEGRVWIATGGGVVRHIPNRALPLAQIAMEVDGRAMQPPQAAGEAAVAPYELPYGARKITFRFTGVSMNGQVRFLYRMTGPDGIEPWHVLPVKQAAEREVSVPGEGQGAYVFEVAALNRDLFGIASPAASLAIRIGPPFWRHGWFYAVVVVLVGLVLSGAVLERRIRHREFVLPPELHDYVPIEPNPFIVGNPIRTEKMFFGREDDFRYVRTKLEGVSQGVVIVFCGERRVGKSSILYQVLNGRLGGRFVPVFVDMQEMVIQSDAEFFSRISRLIAEAVSRSNFKAVPSSLAETSGAAGPIQVATGTQFSTAQGPGATPIFDGRNPYTIFLDFLDEVLTELGDRTLLILMDEYELIESKVDEGKLSQEIFTFLAGLMDNKDRLALIFTGSRRLEERDRKYWRELLRRSLFRKVGFLSEKDTFRLVTEPVHGRVVYGRGVVERIYRLTAGQPFYTQVICQNAVDYMNEHRRNWIVLSDLDSIVDDIVDNPLPHMIYAWEGLSDDEKMVASVLAERLGGGSAFSNAAELKTRIKSGSYPVHLSEHTVRLTLEEMLRREILDRDSGDGFRFRIDLFREWVQTSHSIWQVINEVRTR